LGAKIRKISETPINTMKNTRWRRSAYVGGSGGLTYVKPPNRL
jgi:hypothetical protein